MKALLLVAAGGAVGSAMRHLFGLAALRWLGAGFPWGTLGVNLVGSFAMGMFIEALARRFDGSADLRLFVATGLLGGFTTFSAFSLETALLWERGEPALAIAYVAASLVLAVGGLFAGLWLARAFL